VHKADTFDYISVLLFYIAILCIIC